MNELGSASRRTSSFFVREATLGDTVAVAEVEGELRYEKTMHRSRNSLIRVVYYPGTDPGEIRRELAKLGCSTKWDENQVLIAVNIPADASLSAVQEFLAAGLNDDRWGYEEPILRQ